MEPMSDLEHLRRLSGNLLEPEIYIQLVEQLPDALVVIDRNLVVVIYNKQAALLFEYHPSEVIGQPLNTLLPGGAHLQHEEHLRRWFDNPVARPMALRTGLRLEGRRKDGMTFPVMITLAPIVSPSGLYGMAVIRREGDAHARQRNGD